MDEVHVLDAKGLRGTIGRTNKQIPWPLPSKLFSFHIFYLTLSLIGLDSHYSPLPSLSPVAGQTDDASLLPLPSALLCFCHSPACSSAAERCFARMLLAKGLGTAAAGGRAKASCCCPSGVLLGRRIRRQRPSIDLSREDGDLGPLLD